MSDTATPLELPLTIAHRGLSAKAPENTLSSVRAAHEAGCRWVELDVQLLADGTPVIWHDAGVRRCSNGRGKLRCMTLDEARTLDVGRWFSPAYESERIATLEEALTLIRDLGMGLNLEIKVNRGCDAKALVSATVHLAIEALPRGRLLVSSFSMTALNILRHQEPDPERLPLGILYEKPPRTWREEAGRLDAFSLHVDWRRLKRAKAEEIASSPYRLLCYTVNDPGVYQRLRQWGADAIISDDPSRLQACPP